MSELYGRIGYVVGEHGCDKDARITELEARIAELDTRRCETCRFAVICDRRLLYDVDNPGETIALGFCSLWGERGSK